MRGVISFRDGDLRRPALNGPAHHRGRGHPLRRHATHDPEMGTDPERITGRPCPGVPSAGICPTLTGKAGGSPRGSSLDAGRPGLHAAGNSGDPVSVRFG